MKAHTHTNKNRCLHLEAEFNSSKSKQKHILQLLNSNRVPIKFVNYPSDNFSSCLQDLANVALTCSEPEMPSCFVPGCKTGNTQWSGRFTYSSSREMQPKICHLHFEEDFIVKTDKVMMGSVVMTEKQRKLWTLTPNAVPTKFSNTVIPKYFDKKVQARKPPAERQQIVTEEVSATSDMEIEQATLDTPKDLNFDDLRMLQIPLGWMCQQNEESIRFMEMVVDTRAKRTTFCPVKDLEVTNVFTGYRFSVKVRSKDITDRFEPVSSTLEVQKLLDNLISIKLCSGIPNFNIIFSFPSSFKVATTWFADNCPQEVTDVSTCENCSRLKPKLRGAADIVMKKRATAPNQDGKCNTKKILMKRQFKATKARLSRMRNRNLELKKMYTELKACSEASLSEKIDSLNLPPPTKSAMLTSLKVAQAKSKYAVRYSADWLLQSILLKITSPKGYRKLRDSKIVPLPDPAHLTRLLSGISCQFGFSDYVFAELEKSFKLLSKRDSQVMLLVDEMGVQEKVSFEKASMKFKGYIDYADFMEDEKTRKKAKREADHCLVLMIRSLNNKMVFVHILQTQPVASFATRGAAPGNMLVKIILSCIIKLEKVGCEVVGVVSDGATSNKSMWRELGITTKRGGSIVNSVANPVDETRRIFFFCDIPHVFKCIRNHMLKTADVQWSGGTAHWAVYRNLYEVDKAAELRIVPKLTPKHINPNPFQRMKCSYALKVQFIKAYREIENHPLFKGTESTENLLER
ncbi:Transposable element P transposase [Orchesella cincta]|uniref:Transposable element P transposase n=1 Tax=Orchesella cincta TaxID=48709 RepID=A0A1D2M8R3_ORCCI|nr:Transposable element P transposase [Orchesella cincta]